MGAEQRMRKTTNTDGIPEFEPTRDRDDDVTEAIEEMGKGVVNAFTVERDTGLADGAGAPGSTAVGGMGKKDRHER